MSVDEYLLKVGVPVKHIQASFDHGLKLLEGIKIKPEFVDRYREIYEKAKEIIRDQKFGVYFWGINGCGKTYLATAMLREYREKYTYSLSRATAQEIINWFYANNFQGYRPRYLSSRIFLIEEINKEINFNSEHNIKIVENLIKTREESGKITLYTANCSLDEILRRYGEYTQRIISGTAVEFKFPNIDFRNKQVAEYTKKL